MNVDEDIDADVHSAALVVYATYDDDVDDAEGCHAGVNVDTRVDDAMRTLRIPSQREI